jgi:heme-degrading monooxygenase HmoA
MYTYIWAFDVRPDKDDRFRDAYGPEGAWVALFRRAPGYISTQLYQDQRDRHRYVTVDTWASREAHAAFRREFAAPFAELDARCEALTLREELVGEFDVVDDGST